MNQSNLLTENQIVAKRLMLQLFAELGTDQRLYAVLDGAAFVDLPGALREMHAIDHRCLLGSVEPKKMLAVLPHVVELAADDWFSNWLFTDGWGKNWGFYCSSLESIDTMKRHYKKYWRVQQYGPTQAKPQYQILRFCDPRVLQTFLPNLSSANRAAFMRPVQSLWLEINFGKQLQHFTLDSKTAALITHTISVPAELPEVNSAEGQPNV